jgi:nitrate/nitrite transporter NarK
MEENTIKVHIIVNFPTGLFEGHLVDATGSYSTCFFVFAGMITCAGLLTLSMPMSKAVRRRQEYSLKTQIGNP